jgi:predicted secreted Zn-dependent protease
MNRVASRAAAFVLAGTFCAALEAAAPAFTLEQFDIHRATARELRAQLNALGPVGETGLRGDGYTHWRIAWTYDLESSNGRCTANNFRVTLEVRMILPRWTPPPEAAPGLVTLWDQYSAALREHEDGHYQIAIRAADDVRRALAANASAADCRTLQSRLDGAANGILDDTRRRQADYDRDTDSGRAQGTRVL